MPHPLQQAFADAGQGHVFRFFNELSPDAQAHLLQQAEGIDLEEISRLTAHLGSTQHEDFTGLQPAPYIPLPEHGGEALQWREAAEAGAEALRAGRVAAFTVAGGQGTRLGFDGPKGTFPVTPVRKATLFQLFAEKIAAAQRRYETTIPWYVMTSAINHDDTVSFFERHGHFGLDPANVAFFSQGLMPAVDFEGRILMAAKDQIAQSPDGHGGSLRALVRSGCVADMGRRGVDLISYFQVDNPLVRSIDPAFIGFHILGESELSSKACLKAYAEEKVGVFAHEGDKVRVVEYSDLPENLMHETEGPGGPLKFRAGSIAIHVFSRDLVERLGGDDASVRLPFHQARKKVPAIDPTGQPVTPEEPNGIKFEMFVFDALPFARNPVIIETPREVDFSPVKNAEGRDSAQTAKEDQLRLFASWARSSGIDLPVNETGLPPFDFEVTPSFATTAEEFAERASEARIEPGAVL